LNAAQNMLWLSQEWRVAPEDEADPSLHDEQQHLDQHVNETCECLEDEEPSRAQQILARLRSRDCES
jgi:hypothetical protein